MILITGATGFLGSALIKRLQSLSYDVMPLIFGNDVRITTDYWQADLTRSDHVKKLEQAHKKPETIIHLAGYIQIALQPNPYGPTLEPLPGDEDIGALYAANVGATANLVDYSFKVGIKHFIFASTQAVYGMPQETILTETSPCKPLEHYAASKLCAERLLEIASQQGLRVTIARFPGLYAEHRTSGVVYKFCKAALEKKHITVSNNFPLPIDVIHLDDVVAALIKMLKVDHYFLRLHIATGQPCSLIILAKQIAQLVPGCAITNYSGEQPVVTMNSLLAQKILCWQPMRQEERLQQMLKTI